METNQPPNQPSPPDGDKSGPPAAPEPHGATAAPPPYGRPPGEYGQAADAAAGEPGYQQGGHDQAGYQQPGYEQAGYQQGGYQQSGYQQGPPPGYYQQGPPPGSYQPGFPQGSPAPYGWPEPKSRLAAGLLGIFLGGLGIHRFYLGYTTLGIVQLLVTFFTFGAGAIWGFVEGIMILAGARTFRTDARGVPLRE